ncbi:Pre-mRNA-processing factor 17 [Zootermopsis nevadensis]|uniref:Pre-mRNA-processing factor 17 n=1 Tax=Zootermopsis nevadensis TaxID=136037 RepID=A0A067QTS7_ZOONE|nr:Pre-mRNA-processing factor 17 [Zootermopsis nevadensis]
MDSKIVIFSVCTLDFSPDMSYLVSGDADGKCYVWDWNTTKLYKKFKN